MTVDFMQGSLCVQGYCCYQQCIHNTLINRRNAHSERVPLLQLLLGYSIKILGCYGNWDSR